MVKISKYFFLWLVLVHTAIPVNAQLEGTIEAQFDYFPKSPLFDERSNERLQPSLKTELNFYKDIIGTILDDVALSENVARILPDEMRPVGPLLKERLIVEALIDIARQTAAVREFLSNKQNFSPFQDQTTGHD